MKPWPRWRPGPRALAQPEAVRDALLAIERQEGDHASLAFRFVSWSIAAGGPGVRDAARAAFELAGEQIRSAAPLASALSPALDEQLERHGRLSARTRDELRKRGFVEVIAPAARGLLG